MKLSKKHIYKFAAVNQYTLKNLILSQIWFGSPESMNDQLEGLIRIKNQDFKPSEAAIQNFITKNSLERYYWNPFKTIDEIGFARFFIDNWYRQERNFYGISCFSLIPNEPLMWSHYADKHAGICLIYHQVELALSLGDNGKRFERAEINYKEKPIIALSEENNEVVYSSNFPVLTSKNRKWSYEKELRVFTKSTNGYPFEGELFSIDHSVLKGVIYGAKMDESDKDAISLILRNDPLYKDVIEYNAFLDYSKGTLAFERD